MFSSLDPNARSSVGGTFLEGCRESYAILLNMEKTALAIAEAAKAGSNLSQPDDLINWRYE